MNLAIAFFFLIAATPSADTPSPAANIPEPIAKQMREIIIPQVEFQEVGLDEAVDYLRMKTADHQRKKGKAAEGMSFVIKAAPAPEGAPVPADEITLSLQLKKIPLIEALDIVCAGFERHWHLAEDGKVIIGAKPGP